MKFRQINTWSSFCDCLSSNFATLALSSTFSALILLFSALSSLIHCFNKSVSPGLSISDRSEEHTSELQSPCNLVCRLLLEKKNDNEVSTSTVAVTIDVFKRVNFVSQYDFLYTS